MSSKLQAFFKKNKRGQENVKFKLPNFDEELEIRVISSKEMETINNLATKMKTGKKGRQEPTFDATTYNRELCIASLVVPNLHDAELQASYGCMGASELFGEMFNWGEQSVILEKIAEAANIDNINDLVDEAKN